jgi:adenine-specific DNA-methyltransferase
MKEKMESSSLAENKESIIREINKRVADKIIEKTNAELLIKLIEKSESLSEAISIAELGTTYKRTGLHFDKRLEKISSNIKYLQKNLSLSFTANDDKSVNKLIIGENYDALMNLLIEYKNKIDVIYIDPPYSKNDMGEFATTNYNNNLTRDNLLSMLYPRLMLAKELLSENGVIFCSIDDKNQAYLKCLFDEVFGEVNSSGMLVWQKKKKPSFLSKNFGTIFEYVLCYCKNYKDTYPFSVETTTLGKKYPFNNAGNSISTLKFPAGSVSFNMPDCIVKAQDMSEGNIKTELLNDVEIKDGKNINEFSLKGEWRYSQDTLNNEILKKENAITISQVPFRPNYIKDGGEIKKMNNFLSQKSYNCETNEDGTNELSAIFSDLNVSFANPKPVGLIELLLKATTYDKENAIILDFFAGSGTTGEAVLKLNRDIGGNRKFILCTNNEKTDNTPNGIAYDITTKRLKRVMTGKCYDGTSDFKLIKDGFKPYNGSLDVFEISSVASFEKTVGKTPFEVIDERAYDLPKFNSIKDKIDWVCNNFEHTESTLESEENWKNRVEE